MTNYTNFLNYFNKSKEFWIQYICIMPITLIHNYIDVSLSNILKYISAIEIKHRVGINMHTSKGLNITYIIQALFNA